jgi:hypothetical protein
VYAPDRCRGNQRCAAVPDNENTRQVKTGEKAYKCNVLGY